MNCFAVLVVLLCCTGLVTSSLINGVLPNGDFEQGPNPWDLQGSWLLNPVAIPNWQTSGFVEYIESGHSQGNMLLVVPDGSHAVRLGNHATLKTKVNLTIGVLYSLSFAVARTCAQEERLNVSVTPNVGPKDWGFLPVQTIYSCHGWDSFSWGFLAEDEEVEIAFHHPQTEMDNLECGPIIDLVALKAFPLPKFTKEIVKNGNFEEGPYFLPNASSGILIPSNLEDSHSPLLGWTVESLKAVRYIDSDHFTVPEGKRAVELLAGRESIIGQIVKTVPGRVYNLSFYVGDAKNGCEGPMLVEVAVGKSNFQIKYDSDGLGGSELVNLEIKARGPYTRVRFLSLYYHMKNDNSGTLCGPVIDGVCLS